MGICTIYASFQTLRLRKRVYTKQDFVFHIEPRLVTYATEISLLRSLVASQQ